jgi:hypothetical protein
MKTVASWVRNKRKNVKYGSGHRHLQSGQAIVEYILLTVIIVAISTLVRNLLIKNRAIESLTYKPWSKIDGMIQCGAWRECGYQVGTGQLHPESAERVISVRVP